MRPKAIFKQLNSLIKAPNFTSREAAQLGVSTSVLAHYLKQGDLERLSRGVYRFADAPAIEEVIAEINEWLAKNGVSYP